LTGQNLYPPKINSWLRPWPPSVQVHRCGRAITTATTYFFIWHSM